MSDEQNNIPQASEQDEIKNLKAEMNRKHSNIEQSLKNMTEQLQKQIELMNKPKNVEPVKEGSSLEDLFYKDPAAYAAKIKEQTIQSMDERISAREAQMASRNNTIAHLAKEFPELNRDDHELTQLALRKYNEMSKDSGATPATYKAAVYEAALESGLKPKSKRPDSDDDFVLSGNEPRRQAKKRNSDDLDPGVIEAARAFGVDPERVKARMKNSPNFKMIKR